jgi:release factor glutamine methyltransferase
VNAARSAVSIARWLDAHADLDRRDREVLLGAAAGIDRARILSRPETPLSGGALRRPKGRAARRRSGEPLAYLLGHKEFWGLELAVSPQVLIPRPETELLVEQALDLGVDLTPAQVTILELGTGSGAVAIAIAIEAARRGIAARITATDVSAGALRVAAGNGRRHRTDVRWLVSDWYGSLSGRFDLILSNPPYVRAGDPHLHDLAHEPSLALVSGDDGLDALRVITAGAPAHLQPRGWLVLEHGFDQGAAVRALLGRAGFERIETLPDLAGLERVTRGRLP